MSRLYRRSKQLIRSNGIGSAFPLLFLSLLQASAALAQAVNNQELNETVQQIRRFGENIRLRVNPQRVIVSGGPCIYNSQDPELHDKSWANYVTSPLLQNPEPADKSKKVFWLIYKPAYELRWKDDLKARDFRKEHVASVKRRGFSSYVDLLENRSIQRNWSLVWIESEVDFWKFMLAAKPTIGRFEYFGHAANDLWLTCTHDENHQAIAPDMKAIIHGAHIAMVFPNGSRLFANPRLSPEQPLPDPIYPAFFNGCNTESFAKRWNETFRSFAYGYRGKIDFSPIHETGGKPVPVKNAEQIVFAPKSDD